MSTMTDLFETLDQQRVLLLDALQGLPDGQLEQKGVAGEWSIKNVLAHLVAWEIVVTGFLPERLATGARPASLSAIDDEDAWNAQQVAAREHLTPREQLVEFSRARQQLFQVLRAAGEEALNRQHPWPGWDGTLAAYVQQGIGDHESEHREAVLTAIARLRAA